VFRCPSCVADIDRDINGARNILLRYLTVNQKEPAFASVRAYPLGS
jgi:transposase